MDEPRPEGVDLQPLDGAPGPAPLISRQREDALVEVVLARRFGRRRLRVPHLSRAAAAILITFAALGAAAAITYLVVRERPAPLAPERPRPPVRQPAAQPQPVRPDLGVPLPDVGSPDSTPASTPTRRPPRARDLLARANRKRSARRWREAERLYRRVIRRHPGSDQAYAATLAAASLRLEKLGDPKGALRLLKRALADRRHRSLRQEILYGIAECHRALGNRRAEARALRAYLEAFPDGAMQRRARQRLRALGR
jgi:tetratricopeptide (TPR) repeat protein